MSKEFWREYVWYVAAVTAIWGLFSAGLVLL